MQVCRMLARCVNKRQTLAVTALMVGLLALGGDTAAADTGTRLQGSAASTVDESRVVSFDDDLATAVCAALKVPVSKGVNALIRLLSEGRYRGTLAGSIFSSVGFKPWCNQVYPRLESRLRSALNRRPDLRQESGSFVFDLRATAVPSTVYANSSYFTVRWSEFPRLTPRDTYYLWYRLNGGQWYRIFGGQNIHLRRGNRVQFALRVRFSNGQTSPWVFSITYFT